MKEEKIGHWMKRRSQRIDILLDNDFDICILSFFETFLQCYFRPKNEGFASQRMPNQPVQQTGASRLASEKSRTPLAAGSGR